MSPAVREKEVASPASSKSQLRAVPNAAKALLGGIPFVDILSLPPNRHSPCGCDTQPHVTDGETKAQVLLPGIHTLLAQPVLPRPQP